ncbi:MAG TPA: thiamine pyrophosphate-dependent enzyme [Gemmatimonadaceae bacterium]|nr:thiamine pyrophosphate-dependent enzyme [Gemmatimonadaceae bacterium]
MSLAGMPMREAVATLRDARGPKDIVIPSMGSAREWMALGPVHDLDFILVPSAMGHATSVGLGLALAQPDRRVIVLSGDGSLLMNLGSLVTISAESPANLVIVVFVNGVYEVTGAQVTPGPETVPVDYAALARASGIQSVFRWSSLDDWRSGIDSALGAVGPTLVVLDVAPVPGAAGPRSPGPTGERVKRFMAAVGVNPIPPVSS